MNDRKQIPTRTIGILSELLPEFYTHATLDSLFFITGGPEEIKFSHSNKTSKVQGWLRTVNIESEYPIEILSIVIEDFLSKAEPHEYYYSNKTYDSFEKASEAFQADVEKINNSLKQKDITLSPFKAVVPQVSSSTLSLQELVKLNSFEAVESEINRALDNVEKDPPASVGAAASLLEAVFKVYLEAKSIKFSEKDTFSPLWKKVSEDIGLRKKSDSEDIAKIFSGLNKITDGILSLRNNKSSFHGKSQSQIKSYKILPRHARLAIHSSHTIALYILELLEQ